MDIGAIGAGLKHLVFIGKPFCHLAGCLILGGCIFIYLKVMRGGWDEKDMLINVKMGKFENVKMGKCENVKMGKWENERMRECAD